MTQGLFGGFNPGVPAPVQQPPAQPQGFAPQMQAQQPAPGFAPPPWQQGQPAPAPQQHAPPASQGYAQPAPQHVQFDPSVRFQPSQQFQFGNDFDATPAGATRHPQFDLGSHVVEVVCFDAKTGPKGTNFIFEGKVVESNNPNESGTRTWIRNLDGKARIPGMGEVKKFFAAYIGMSVTDPTFLEWERTGVVSRLLNEAMATGQIGASIGQQPVPLNSRKIRVIVTQGDPVPAAKRDDPSHKLYGVSHYKNVIFQPY